jgi:chorismate mutase
MTPRLSIEPIGMMERPMIIAGPCSAESEPQVVETARRLAATGRVSALRAGVWKPRTRPGQFEGAGVDGLRWLTRARQETGLPVATEVGNASHVEACLAHGIDVLWVGARTTVSPFAVQEIADALQGVDVPVLVKNPVSPDIGLWVGALERLNRAGVKRLGAVFRGFTSVDSGPFHNVPLWDLAIELKTHVPGMPVLCDPSHICGSRDLIPLVAQKAFDLDLDGLMIESHIDPDAALSDAKQQLSPSAVLDLLAGIVVRMPSSSDAAFTDALRHLRDEIDRLDDEIMRAMAARMRVSERIGRYKLENNVTILQVNRWDAILRTRSALGVAMGLDEGFTRDLLRLVHHESIQVQARVMNGKEIGVGQA